MKKRTSPPWGYYITDYKKEIKQICDFLEKEGFKFKLENKFCIKYLSSELIISIVFERYGETVWVYYSFPNTFEDINKNHLKKYNIAWVIAKFKDGILWDKYFPNGLVTSKIEQICGCINFFKDHKDLLLNINFSDEMYSMYGEVMLNKHESKGSDSIDFRIKGKRL